MKQRGRPIRGAIAGLFFGLFLSLDLVIFGVVAIDSNLLVLFPVLGLAGGIALGLKAPLHKRAAVAAAPAAVAAAPAGPAGPAAGADERPVVVASSEAGPNPA
ncbi:MAG TPA: hypothetical protein VGO87_11810 [Acidimicrobiia bacterium]